MVAATKKKRVSKKKKISWRKNVDISDVNAFLEDQRLEERLGTPFAERKDEELFTIDTKAISKKPPAKTPKPIKYEPKCFQMLKSLTKVPDPISKRNHVNPLGTKPHPLAAKKRVEKDLKKRELRKSARQNLIKKKLNKKENLEKLVSQDVWSVESLPEITKNQWLESNTVRHHLSNTRNKIKKVPKSVVTKKSVIPPIEKPHPGVSYNPSLADHQTLLKEVGDHEAKMMKKEKHLLRVTSEMFSKSTESKKQAAWINEMTEGLPVFDGKKKSKKKQVDDEVSDSEFKSINPPVENKKKDLKKRRKQTEQQKLEYDRMMKKIEKKKASDILKVETLKAKLAKTEKKTEKLREKRKENEELKKFEPKRLGRLKFEKPEIEFNAGEDLSGNLRNIKMEGSLLKDRFKSLQKRNILEPTKIQMRKRMKVKKFVKADHKIPQIKK